MSVLVKGMEIPENCWECPCMRHDSYDNVNKYQCNVTFDIVGEHKPETRPDNCPLVALPDKHGDLIDRDAFRADYGMNADCADCEKEMRGKVKECEYDRIYSKMDFCSWIDVADTIVEAEDSE